MLCSFRGGEGFRVPGVGVILFEFCFLLGATKGKALTRDLYQRERETKKKNSRAWSRSRSRGATSKKNGKKSRSRSVLVLAWLNFFGFAELSTSRAA